MRRLCSIALLLCLSACGMAEDEREEDKRREYISLPDPAFEAYCLETYDLNGDGRLSRYEAERVLYIDCSGRGIESLYGIANFTALRELDCADNRIPSLELDRLDRLESLDCSGNGLRSLAVGKLRALWRLDCADNLLAELDLQSCVSLSWLDCSNNDLHILDVANCARPMTYLNAAGNASLTLLYKSVNQPIDRLHLDGQVRIEER